MNETYERNGMRITRAKVLCVFAGEKFRVKEQDRYRHRCRHPVCARFGTWCDEDWRLAEVRCPNYAKVTR